MARKAGANPDTAEAAIDAGTRREHLRRFGLPSKLVPKMVPISLRDGLSEAVNV